MSQHTRPVNYLYSREQHFHALHLRRVWGDQLVAHALVEHACFAWLCVEAHLEHACLARLLPLMPHGMARVATMALLAFEADPAATLKHACFARLLPLQSGVARTEPEQQLQALWTRAP